MMRGGEATSACGTSGSLRAIALWGIKAEPAGVASTSRVMWIKPRANLDMPDAKIARSRRARKWYTEYQAHFIPNIRPSLSDSEHLPSQEAGPLSDLLSSPPSKRPKKRFIALKAYAKRLLIAAYCHGLVSAKTTQRLIDKFELWSA